MLGEATSAELILDPGCERWIFECDETDARPKIHESYGPGWWLSDRIPRWELDNSSRPPGYPFKWCGNGTRCAEHFRRAGNLYFHSTVGITPRPGVVTVETRLPRATRSGGAAGPSDLYRRIVE